MFSWEPHHRVWLILSVGWLFMTINRVAISPALPLIIAEFSLTYADAGFLVGTFFYGYIATQIPAGLIGDRVGNRRVLLIGTYVWSVFALLTGFARSAFQLFGLRIGMALGQGTYFSNDRAMVSTSSPREASGRSHGLSFLGTGLGYSLGILLGGFFAESIGWRFAFMALAIPGFIVGLFLWKGIRPPEKNSQTKMSLSIARRLLMNSDLFVVSIISLLLNYSLWVLLIWSPTILVEQGTIQLSSASILASVTGFASIPGLLLFGSLGDYCAKRRIGRKSTILGGFIGIAMMLILLALELQGEKRLPLMVTYLFFAGFFNWGLWPSTFAIVGKVTPEEHRSLSFGIVNSFTFVSAIVAPWATGIVRDATGLFSTALYVAAIVAVIGLVFTMLLRPAFRFSKEDDVYVAD